MALYDDVAGKPLQKIYKRVGLRRDLNFSDLSSPSTSLENLLNELKDDDDSTYLASDLAVINGIFSAGLTNSNYLQIAQSAAKITKPDGKEISYNPRITYQNRIDKISIFSGIPRLNGGNGLKANYYQNDQILFDEHANFEYNIADVNVAGVAGGNVFGGETGEGVIPPDNFWEDGNFGYTAKIHPQSAKSNTGVKWEGYFIPRLTGKVQFEVSSTGYFTMDFQKEGYFENSESENISGIGTYTEYIRVGMSTEISGISSTIGLESSGNSIVVDTAQLEKMNTIGIGMTVVHPNIALNTRITSFDKETGVIVLNPPSGFDSSVTGTISNQNMEFTRHLGDVIEHRIETPVLLAYNRYRIRLRYFHHKNFDSKDIERSFGVDFRLRDMPTDADLRFNNLFSLDYDFTESAKGEFNRFSDNSIFFGGTNIVGLGNSTDSSEYTKIKSSKKLDVTYKPKQELGNGSNLSTGIVRNQKNYNIISGSSLIFISTANDLTSGVEIGNYIINDNIPDGTRVIDIQPNQFIVMNNLPTATASGQQVKFINHRGFVKRVRVNQTTNGNQLTAASGFSFRSSGTHSVGGVTKDAPNERTINTDSQKDMIVISAGINGYKRIGSISIDGSSVFLKDDSVTYDTDASVSTAANEDVFVYQSRGIKDNSLQGFCDRFANAPTVRCLISNIAEAESPKNVGVTTFFVEDINGVGIGWEVQGAYFGTDGISIANIETNPSSSDYKLITLSSGITRAFPDGAQITAVAPAKNTSDYTLCCPPTDTSPPFEPSEEGLNTTTEYKNIELVGGNLVFEELSIVDSANNAVDIPDGDALSVDRKIDIRSTTADKTYKILGQKIN
mgnify:FL=1